MHPSTAALLVTLCSACGPALATAIPPALELPIPPAPRALEAPPPPAPTPVASASSAPDPTPTWVETIHRFEKTTKVAPCQMVPFTFASRMTVEDRMVGTDRIAIRVVQDDETAAHVAAPPSLSGKSYVVETTGAGLHVRDSRGDAVPDAQLARVQPLASAFLAWPGAAIAAHPPAASAEVPSLEGPVAAMAGVPLFGGEPRKSKATVRFSGARPVDGEDVLVFDVSLAARDGDAGMCHAWTSRASLKGTLRIRAKTGAFLALQVKGATSDTEALCQRADGKPGPPPPPRTCNRGNVTIDMTAPHAP